MKYWCWLMADRLVLEVENNFLWETLSLILAREKA
jgi:hypothetical protein